MYDTIITNGLVVDTEKTYKANIYIENEKIVKIDAKDEILQDSNTKIIDAKGKYILPGGIDPHVHFYLNTPAGYSSDDFRSGSMAALSGGTTSFIDFVTPQRKQSLIEALHERKREAENTLIDYSLHMSITAMNKNTRKEIVQCINLEGINSFKMYMAYQKNIGVSDEVLLEAMHTIGKEKGLVLLHCENDSIIEFSKKKLLKAGKNQAEYHPISRPSFAESEAVNRAAIYSNLTDCPLYIVHVSSGKSIQTIKKHKKAGSKIFTETCPQYLILDDTAYQTAGNEKLKFVMSPPLRKKTDKAQLWNAISSEIVDTLATDHCPFNTVGQKDRALHDFTKIANGAGGVEHRLALLFTFGVLKNKLTINQMVNIVSTKAAKIFGLTNKGEIKTGKDADLLIWNPKTQNTISRKTHVQNCDSNIYESIRTFGEAEMVMQRGKILFQNGKFILDNVKGKFIKRNRHCLDSCSLYLCSKHI